MFRKILTITIVATTFVAGLVLPSHGLVAAHPLQVTHKNKCEDNRVFRTLMDLYPYFTSAQVQQKLGAASDPLHFLRSFIPYSYWVMHEHANEVGLEALYVEYYGWCTGDPHLENFGSLLNGGNQWIFTLNDLDDAGPCPLFADLLRFLVAINLATDSSKYTESVIASYLSGLQRQPHELSKSVQSILDQAKQDGTVPDTQLLSNESTIKRSSDTLELSRETTQDLYNILQQVYPSESLSFVDQVQELKTSGGSALLTRYLVLLDRSGKRYLMEFKQLETPGIYPYTNATIPKADERVTTSLSREFFENPNAIYTTVSYDSMDMFLRPKFAGNHGVTQSKYAINSGDLKDVILDEANTIGDIHAESFEATSSSLAAYIQAIGAIQSSSKLTKKWLAAVAYLIKYINDSYNEVHDCEL